MSVAWLYGLGLVGFLLVLIYAFTLVGTADSLQELFSRRHILGNFRRTGKLSLWAAGALLLVVGGGWLLAWLIAGTFGLPLMG